MLIQGNRHLSNLDSLRPHSFTNLRSSTFESDINSESDFSGMLNKADQRLNYLCYFSRQRPLKSGRIRSSSSSWFYQEDTAMTTEDQLLDRITVRSDVFGGKPIIRDMRIAVEHVLAMLAAGDSNEIILNEYPDLDADDIRACLTFAYRSIAGEQIYDRLHVQRGSSGSN